SKNSYINIGGFLVTTSPVQTINIPQSLLNAEMFLNCPTSTTHHTTQHTTSSKYKVTVVNDTNETLRIRYQSQNAHIGPVITYGLLGPGKSMVLNVGSGTVYADAFCPSKNSYINIGGFLVTTSPVQTINIPQSLLNAEMFLNCPTSTTQ
ncbi:MAG: hypothetical protein QXK13_06995, partial [Fervidicoccaceae archaeon]|uniref:hypothetical protein n=1 Tax=Thermofilum sp. TaxID=1961369 RepID=UPI00315E2626